MSKWIRLKAEDGHELDAYVAEPEGVAIGAVVVVQEIFGVNPHIQSIADRLAQEGFVAIAPALFDRFERGVSLRYEGEDMQRALGFYQQLKPELALLDVAAASKFAAQEAKAVSVVGFCYGGFMSWLSATRGPDAGFAPACTVGYYPGGIGGVATQRPTCPVLLHFGGKDSHIGPDQIAAVRAQNYSDVTIYVYEGAEHGFNCDARASFGAEPAALAWRRTLDFLKKHGVSGPALK